MRDIKNNLSVLILLFLLLPIATNAFVQGGDFSYYDPAGFFSGIWHGLLAPYSLIVRWFIDIQIYATPNTGWFYDLGFLIGIAGSLPIGWAAAILSIVGHVFL